MPNHFAQEAGNVWSNHELTTLRAEFLRHQFGVGAIVARLLHARVLPLKCDGVTAKRPTMDFRRTCQERAGIQTSGKKKANWHIAHQLPANGILENRAALLGKLSFVAGHPRNSFGAVPIAIDADLSTLPGQPTARLQLQDVLEHRSRVRYIQQRQKL